MYATPAQDRHILARYEDITAQYRARVNEIGEEFAQQLAEADADAAERARLAAEPVTDAASEPAEAPVWERRQRRTVMSFAGEDEFAPAEPAQPPVPPPVEPPASRPVRPAVPNHVLSFGVDDDEDLSGQKWMR